MNPYDELLRNRSEVAKHYAAMAFNSTTWRMFKKGESEEIRVFLMREVGDGRELAACRASEYNEKLLRLVGRFQHKFHMNKSMKHRKPGFGHASKVINLYIRHLLLLPDYMAPFKRQTLERRAHVPLDKWVLKRVWGDKKKVGDFCEKLDSLKYRPRTLNALDKNGYRKIQGVLADAARKRHVPPITYDYFYSWRGR